MNYSTAVFIINDKARAVLCSYEPRYDPSNPSPVAKPSTNDVVFKTMDQDIKVGDFVVVPTSTRHNMTVCRVVQTDLEIDYNSTVQMQWLIGKVDVASHEEIITMEEKAISVVKSAENNRIRKQLQQSIFADQEEKMMTLELTDLSQSKPKPPVDPTGGAE